MEHNSIATNTTPATPGGCPDAGVSRLTAAPTSLMTPEQAREKEAEVHSGFAGFREHYRGDPPVPPEEDGRAVHCALCEVGEFWKDGHGHVYFTRHADGEDYRVGSNPRWRFPRFVGGLLNLPIRAARTREALDQIEERMRAKAP